MSSFSVTKAEDSLGLLLWQTTMTWQRLIKKALDPYDLAHTQFVIMAILLWFEEKGIEPTQVEIANWSKLDKMVVSKSLKKLVTVGFVNRVEHETDTRAKSVSLTKKGKALIHWLVPIVEQIDAEFFSRISENKRKHFIQNLRKLTEDELQF